MYGRPQLAAGGRLRRRLPVRRVGRAYPALHVSGNELGGGAATIAAYGGMLLIALEAASELILEHELFCEVVALSQLLPADLGAGPRVRRATGALVTRRRAPEPGASGPRSQAGAGARLARPPPPRAPRRRRGRPDPGRARSEEEALPQVQDVRRVLTLDAMPARPA